MNLLVIFNITQSTPRILVHSIIWAKCSGNWTYICNHFLFCFVQIMDSRWPNPPWGVPSASVCKTPGKPSTWFLSGTPVECWLNLILFQQTSIDKPLHHIPDIWQFVFLICHNFTQLLFPDPPMIFSPNYTIINLLIIFDINPAVSSTHKHFQTCKKRLGNWNYGSINCLSFSGPNYW